uniref:Uncharacterized protein n=1 Tax=Onchocerca volvulus TaxID=6282 RepID=A0A8R1XXS8_ONCVO
MTAGCKEACREKCPVSGMRSELDRKNVNLRSGDSSIQRYPVQDPVLHYYNHKSPSINDNRSTPPGWVGLSPEEKHTRHNYRTDRAESSR